MRCGKSDAQDRPPGGPFRDERRGTRMHISGGRSHGRARLGSGRAMAVTLAVLLAAFPGAAHAAVSLAAWIQHSPDDISGFATLTGDENVATVALPFTVTIEGVGYSTVAIS